MINFIVHTQDGDGNEIVILEGHQLLIGKESFIQVQIPEPEYPEGIVCEFGGSWNFIGHDGKVHNMADEMNREFKKDQNTD